MDERTPTGHQIRHGERVSAYYVFLDVVRFTERSERLQTKIIEQLNEIVRAAVNEQGITEPQRIFLPTGDGICVVLIGDLAEPDMDLKIARDISKRIRRHNATSYEESRFEIRIGINDNLDILIKDINYSQNIAGEGINTASRIMSLADGFQILLGPRAYERIKPHISRSQFQSFPAVLKHSIPQTVHQYLGEANDELNTNAPAQLVQSQTEVAIPTMRLRELIAGTWTGHVNQGIGKGIDFDITFEFKAVGSQISGKAWFLWQGKRIDVRITRGRFLPRDYVRLDYEDCDFKIVRWGTVIFQLVCTELDGRFVGYAPESPRTIAGRIRLTKIA